MTTAATAIVSPDMAGQRARAALLARWAAITGQPAPAAPSRSGQLAARLRSGGRGPCATLSFTELCQAPDWISLPPDQLALLARAVTLALHAGTIRKTISGDQLRAVTAIFGEAMVDQILASPGTGDAQSDAGALSLPLPVDRRDAEECGLAVLALAAPPALARRISRHRRALPIDARRAREAVADAVRLAAPEPPAGDNRRP